MEKELLNKTRMRYSATLNVQSLVFKLFPFLFCPKGPLLWSQSRIFEAFEENNIGLRAIFWEIQAK